MDTNKYIPQFPKDIDRRDFGNWLSGFTDGEGYFILILEKNKEKQSHGRTKRPRARFGINLRADDHKILELVQSFFHCGRLVDSPRKDALPQKHFVITSCYDLLNVVIPHFEKHPLRAKKQRDFNIWRQGVEIISNRDRRHKSKLGWRWTKNEITNFVLLFSALRQQREFSCRSIVSTTFEKETHPLFDLLSFD